MRHVIKYSLFCMFAVAVSVAQVPTAGLAAWYPFNGNANDSTGHALNDGKLFVTNPTPFVAGRNGSGLACNLDGVDDFILIPNKSSFNLPRDSAVISGWYDADACSKITADPRYLWDAYELSNTGERREVSLTIANSTDSLGKPCRRLEAVAIVSNNTDTELLVLPFVEYDTGWHCAAVEWEKPILAFFVDGVPAGQVTASIPDAKLSTNNRTTYFGTDVFTAAKCFCGLIDDIRLYNRAMSDSEITLLSKEGSGEPVVSAPMFQTASSSRVVIQNALGGFRRAVIVDCPAGSWPPTGIGIFTVDGRLVRNLLWRMKDSKTALCVLDQPLGTSGVFVVRVSSANGSPGTARIALFP